MSLARWAFVPFVSVGLVIAGLPAGIAQAAAPDESAKNTAPPAQAPTKAATAKVTGFRSAQFGMTVDEVTKAIAKDFHIAAADVRTEHNPTERTTDLIIHADDLQAGAGPTAIAYIFGYSSQRLFQVNVAWGARSIPRSIRTA
jgi:hypothetical protein